MNKYIYILYSHLFGLFTIFYGLLRIKKIHVCHTLYYHCPCFPFRVNLHSCGGVAGELFRQIYMGGGICIMMYVLPSGNQSHILWLALAHYDDQGDMNCDINHDVS